MQRVQWLRRLKQRAAEKGASGVPDALRLSGAVRKKGGTRMLTAVSGAAIGTGFMFLMTSCGAALVFCMKKSWLQKGERLFLSLTAGVMLAASVWSLLLPAQARSARPALSCGLGVAAGTVFMLLMTRLARRGMGRLRGRPALLLLSIGLHNIPEGMAVGLAFAAACGDGTTTLAAMTPALAFAMGIGIQNLPEGAAVSLPLCQGGASRGRAFWAGVASGAVEPVFGVLAVVCARWMAGLLPFLMAFSAGGMLCVTVQEMIPEGVISGRSGLSAGAAMAGFVLMMCLDMLL